MLCVCCRKLLIDRFSNKYIQCLQMSTGIDSCALMALAADTDAEAAPVCDFRFGAFLLAKREVIVNSTVEVGNKLCSGSFFIGDGGWIPCTLL